MSQATTMNDVQPQPAKKRRIEDEVPLYLPAEVVVPPFYKQEPDDRAISMALQLGAEAVCHIRRQAEELRLQELRDRNINELTQRVLELETELPAVREKAGREVEQLVAEQTLVLTQTLQLRNGLRDDDVKLFESVRQKLRGISQFLDDLEKQTKDQKRSADVEETTIRDDERQQANAHAQRMTSVYESEVEFLQNLQYSLDENMRLKFDHKEKEIDDLKKKLREAEDRALVAYSKSTGQGAAGEAELSELLKQAFGMAQDFELRDTASKPNSGDLMVRMWGLQTMWDCKNYSSNVPSTQVTKIKSDLAAHPEIDVAFLVSLQTDIAFHRECVFDVELVSPSQTLVYVNRLAANDNPTKLLQVFVRPLLSALCRAKQERTKSRDNSADDLRLSVSRWVQQVSEQHAELAAEQKELAEEKKYSAARYKAREAKIKQREGDLLQMVYAMKSCS